ncbi:MAG: type I CRISPR-associated protein Cas7 [Thiotrichales bacterium]|nr:type I CRISPR-associated protein Cas7 [Thiotrichales bacterium]
MSNPNGDPDMESEPRTRELDGLGMISPVSLKRKLYWSSPTGHFF